MSAVTASVASTVNVHYLDHVMTVAEERPVEATEDIYAANGMKLVAKGYAINRSMRDRLLEHQLVRPLEDCMAVSDGVTGARCAQMAEQLLDTHPALRALDLPPSAPNAVKMMADSTYAGRLQTLLTVYNEHRPGKLAHGVCVSLFALNLAQRASLHDTKDLDVMLLAGLAHDVGELYIDPAYLAPGARLGIKEWRHIAAHPVIAHNLLKDLPGLARPASALILEHHERCDGYGYPLGKRGTQLSLPSQILAAAEILTGILEKGDHLLAHADIAVKLIHGEFSREVVDAVSSARRQHQHVPTQGQQATELLSEALQHSRAMGHRLQQIMATQNAFEAAIQHSSATFKTLWAEAQERFRSILRAWSSTGLDVQPDGAWLHQEPASMQQEVAFVLQEIRWRLRELERELLARTTQHAPGDLSLLERYLAEVRQQASATDTPESEAPLT